MSQRLAEERKAVEETKKFYNEEIPDDVEEAEFTGGDSHAVCIYQHLQNITFSIDPDTSDHEFIQNEAEEDAGESDACSDLDEQEGVRQTCEDGSDEVAPGGEGGDIGEVGEESEGEPGDEEMDGYSAGEESDGGGYFSDNEDVMTSRSRLSKKQRLLDSDDEEMDSPPPPSERENQLTVPLKGRGVTACVRRPSVIGEEASMGILMLNESFENENTNTISTVEGNGTSPLTSQTSALPAEVDPGDEPVVDASASLPVSSANGREVVPADSGVGGSLEEEDVAQEGQDTEDAKQHEDEEEEEDSAPTQAIPDSDKDNSLESSLLWAPSLAPAQVWRESLDTNTCGTDEASQWQDTAEVGSRILDHTQNISIDEETQFLDANG